VEKLDLDDVGCQAIMHVPANVDMRNAKHDVGKLLKHMETKSPGCSYFALASTLHYDPGAETSLSWLWLGFLPVLAVLDWWRGLCNWWGYHHVGDVRIETLTTTFPARKHVERESPWPWRSWLCCSRYAGRKVARKKSAVVQHVRAGEEWLHLSHTISSDPHMVWFLATLPIPVANCLWVPAFAVYYWMFAIPWWKWLLTWLVTGYVPANLGTQLEWLTRPLAIFYEYPLSRIWWPVLIAHMLFVVTPITMRRMQLGGGYSFFCLVFYPFYLTLSPLLWCLIKISH